MNRKSFEDLCRMQQAFGEKSKHPIAILINEFIKSILKIDGKKILTELFKCRNHTQN